MPFSRYAARLLVDWLSESDRGSFWPEHGTFLVLIAILAVIVLPTMNFFYETFVNQGLLVVGSQKVGEIANSIVGDLDASMRLIR